MSTPGKAEIFVRPASIAPARAKAKDETQAPRLSFTFKCYGADVTTSDENFVLCPEP